MHFSDLIELRTRSMAGLYVTLTLRCPLSCAHCTTNSSNRSPHHDGEIFTSFFDRMTPDSRPDVAFLTGGEPLIRPHLVRAIARRMRDLGGATACLTGGYFARLPQIPYKVREAMSECDLVIMSMDEFHAKEVPPAALLRALRMVRTSGPDVGLQLTARSADDPFILDLIQLVRSEFDDSIPMFTSLLGPSGRGVDLFPAAAGPQRALTETPPPLPCRWATWPVIASNGDVLACCNSELTEKPTVRPHGLVLGNARFDSWADIRQRSESSAFLSCTRSLGPLLLADQLGDQPTNDYCGTCKRTAARPDVEQASATIAATPLGRAALQITKAGPNIADYTPARHAELMTLGQHR